MTTLVEILKQNKQYDKEKKDIASKLASFLETEKITKVLTETIEASTRNYLLLDVNGTVGTDERPLLEYLENPEDFVWVDKVLAHIRLSTLERIKTISETYDVTVLWASLRADDALCLNQLIDVSWGWLDVNSIVDRSNEWSKVAGIVKFYNEHPDSSIVICDDMLRVGQAYNELKSQAKNIKTIIPSTTMGMTKEELDEVEDFFKNVK